MAATELAIKLTGGRASYTIKFYVASGRSNIILHAHRNVRHGDRIADSACQAVLRDCAQHPIAQDGITGRRAFDVCRESRIMSSGFGVYRK